MCVNMSLRKASLESYINREGTELSCIMAFVLAHIVLLGCLDKEVMSFHKKNHQTWHIIYLADLWPLLFSPPPALPCAASRKFREMTTWEGGG